MYNDDDLYVDVDVVSQGAIESFAQGFRQRWRLDADSPPDGLEWEEWYELLALSAAAREIARAALSLYRPASMSRREINLPSQLLAAKESEQRQIDELITTIQNVLGERPDWASLAFQIRNRIPDPESFKYRFFRTALQIELAYETPVVSSIYSIAERAMDLVNYLDREDDEQVRAYLKSVARCYLFGMVPELCVMSRAVMETALENRLPTEYMRRVRGLRSNERVPLSLRIDEAAASGLLNDRTEAQAKFISDAGSRVAHGENVDQVKADEILTALNAVVVALQRQKQ